MRRPGLPLIHPFLRNLEDGEKQNREGEAGDGGVGFRKQVDDAIESRTRVISPRPSGNFPSEN